MTARGGASHARRPAPLRRWAGYGYMSPGVTVLTSVMVSQGSPTRSCARFTASALGAAVRQ